MLFPLPERTQNTRLSIKVLSSPSKRVANACRLSIFPAKKKRHFDTSIGGNFESSIGTEELAHLEIIAAMVYRLTKDADLQQIRGTMFEGHFVEHGKALFFTDSGGAPFSAAYFQAKDDPITDLTEDMAAEQKARTAYNHLIDLSDDPGVIDTLRFLREREIVHFQRFGEALDQVQEFFATKRVF